MNIILSLGKIIFNEKILKNNNIKNKVKLFKNFISLILLSDWRLFIFKRRNQKRIHVVHNYFYD